MIDKLSESRIGADFADNTDRRKPSYWGSIRKNGYCDFIVDVPTEIHNCHTHLRSPNLTKIDKFYFFLRNAIIHRH